MIGKWFILFFALVFFTFLGCATTPPAADKRLIPLQEANLEGVLEENEGLEVLREDARELRDFYRGGVQQKGKAEKKFQEKAYPEALQFYRGSCEFFSTLLQHLDEDSADYTLFEGTHILFFPNLLMADNHLKMGLIFRAMGQESAAQRHWKRARSFIKDSLCSERTEWGLSLEGELNSLMASKKD